MGLPVGSRSLRSDAGFFEGKMPTVAYEGENAGRAVGSGHLAGTWEVGKTESATQLSKSAEDRRLFLFQRLFGKESETPAKELGLVKRLQLVKRHPAEHIQLGMGSRMMSQTTRHVHPALFFWHLGWHPAQAPARHPLPTRHPAPTRIRLANFIRILQRLLQISFSFSL